MSYWNEYVNNGATKTGVKYSFKVATLSNMVSLNEFVTYATESKLNKKYTMRFDGKTGDTYNYIFEEE